MLGSSGGLQAEEERERHAGLRRITREGDRRSAAAPTRRGTPMGTRPSTSFASTSRGFARSPGSCATSSGAEAYERDNASVRELGQRLAPVCPPSSVFGRPTKRNSRRKGPIPSRRGLPPAIAPPSGASGVERSSPRSAANLRLSAGESGFGRSISRASPVLRPVFGGATGRKGRAPQRRTRRGPTRHFTSGASVPRICAITSSCSSRRSGRR